MTRKSIARYALIFIVSWIVITNYDGFVFFTFLVLTKQIAYSHIASDRDMKGIYALTFVYTPNSFLRYTSPVKLGGQPVKGFNNGIFIAVDPEALSERPGILKHELRHTQQRLLWGPFFHIIYRGWNEIHEQKGYSWWDQYLSNPFEKDAYIFSNEEAHFNDLVSSYAPRLIKTPKPH